MLWDFVLWDFVLWDFVRRDFVLWDFVLWDFVLWDSVPDSIIDAKSLKLFSFPDSLSYIFTMFVLITF